ATAFWWYYKSTEKLVYEQNLHTAQLMLQEHMVATHLGTDKIQSNRPAFIPRPSEEAKSDWNSIDLLKHYFSKHPGEVKWIWSHENPDAGGPDGQDEAEICKKFLSTPRSPSNPDEPKKTESEYEQRIDEHQYRYFEPIRMQGTCMANGCHTPPLGGPGIDAMSSIGASLAGGVGSPATTLHE